MKKTNEQKTVQMRDLWTLNLLWKRKGELLANIILFPFEILMAYDIHNLEISSLNYLDL